MNSWNRLIVHLSMYNIGAVEVTLGMRSRNQYHNERMHVIQTCAYHGRIYNGAGGKGSYDTAAVSTDEHHDVACLAVYELQQQAESRGLR